MIRQTSCLQIQMKEGKNKCKQRGIINLLLEQTAIDLSSTEQMPSSLQRVGDSENRFVCVCEVKVECVFDSSAD